ncbi:hypothetical protein Val02_66560 [Virgisporangium aliadipatigenens]|uniref:Uncharacterized protein n=1 Tax=Virgisporangium aliadipatigenens TaxID=741659 RepID=A0A8J3YTS8_9ACTN|nr:hypothetical protein [Virgisporangium aliadipatigenens]GIJ49770.1 hypothetical protein Val02_66560 [Virgisporangium aliadipatigenens]
MTMPKPTTHTVEVSEDVYDVLARTAARRETDIDGVLRYLIEAPQVSAAPAGRDDD